MLSSDYIIYIVALIIISVINYWIGNRDVLYPGFMYSFVWTLVFSAYVFSPIEVNIIGTTTCLLIILGTLAFTLGCYLSKLIPMKSCANKANLPYQGVAKYILFIYCLAVLPLLREDLISFAGSGLTSLTGLRTLIVAAAMDGEKVYSSIITGSIIAVAIDSTFIAFIEHTKGRYFIYISVLLSIIYCILNTGRTGFMTLIFGLLAIQLIRKKGGTRFKPAMLSLGVPAILIIVSMMGYMFITHNTVEGDVMTLAVDYFFLYIVGGIAALDSIIQSGSFIAPHHTFQFFTQLCNNFLGTNFDIPLAIDTYVYVPFPTNVYTVYKFFLQDFGFTGTLMVVGFIGFVHGVIYKAAKKGSKYGIYFYAISMYPLLMSFFDDTYYNFRGHIRDILLIVTIYFIIPRLLMYGRRIISSKHTVTQGGTVGV